MLIRKSRCNEAGSTLRFYECSESRPLDQGQRSTRSLHCVEEGTDSCPERGGRVTGGYVNSPDTSRRCVGQIVVKPTYWIRLSFSGTAKNFHNTWPPEAILPEFYESQVSQRCKLNYDVSSGSDSLWHRIGTERTVNNPHPHPGNELHSGFIFCWNKGVVLHKGVISLLYMNDYLSYY